MTLAPRQLAPPRAPEGTPLYLHLPFCAAKCHYCDFFSVPSEGQDLEGMLTAILVEAEMRAPMKPRTVFLGGGTPSLLSTDQLARFLNRLDELTGFRASALEVTAECNPESLDEDKAKALLDLGVGRLSIGFQSLRDDVLELFGRVHTAADSFRAFAAARRAGVTALNVDMIFAAPGQTRETWEEDLQRVLALGPDHLSAYNLTFEEETRFRRWLEQGRLAQAPEELELELFAATRHLAGERGLAAYEISNFAAPGNECAHNVNYWRNGAYVGLGPSAVSKVGHTRFGNPRSVAGYLRQVREGTRDCDWSERLAPRERLAETWWLGLRLTDGVRPSRARRTAACELDPDPALAVAAGLAGHGLLAEEDGHWKLTARGLPVADAVSAEFIRRVPEATAGGRPEARPWASRLDLEKGATA